MIVATAGHIDHGKTLLLEVLTGKNTDRLPEEKNRGMSIDLGFAYKKLSNGSNVGFIDVPGHERFIRNMLAGVTGIDFGLLVIAADDGPMPQTREHLEILDLLEIKRGAIVITKIDKVNDKRVVEVRSCASKLLKNTILFDAPIFPISSLNKIGINELGNYIEDQALMNKQFNSSGNFRLAVDRSFNLKGIGLIVTGSVFSGSVSVGDQLVLSPKGINVRVRSIHSQDNVSNNASTGQRCALNITGSEINAKIIKRGDWILAKEAHAPTKQIDVNIQVHSNSTKALKHWEKAHLHLGTLDVTCRVAILKDREIFPGSCGFAQLVLDQTISTTFGDRFILRDQSAQRTIAGGKIIDPFPPQIGRTRSERMIWLHNMSTTSSKDALSLLIENISWGINLTKFSQKRNLTKKEGETLYKALKFKKITDGKNIWGISKIHWGSFKKEIVKKIKDFHNQFPDHQGINEEKIIQNFKFNIPEYAVKNAIQELKSDKKISQKGKILQFLEHQSQFNSKDLMLWGKMELILNKRKFKVPTVKELTSILDVELKLLEHFLYQASHMRYLVKLNRNRYFFPSTIFDLAKIAEKISFEVDNAELILSRFRDKSGIGRNLSIEVLEFFDKIGFTHRLETGRFIKKPAKEVFSNYL